ncbi:uncharacterized protein (DUF58 family) [Paeniglutamicibacter cryotolerans]|uniref:Uncharacterized protein (DUF58 family) n=1 Tax=Paeniglutamicibacter cryotolerans TaxID=670079 RepID=A0A839QE52_9MICC|nr:uncharacterized protein (DUF58 family) [Paeniglutamicibacter cryotolerans]
MQFLKYTVIRLVLFFIVFLPLAWLGWGAYLAGAVALVVAFGVSYLFLNKFRLGANADVQRLFSDADRKKSKHELEDEAAEDRFQQED